MTRAAVLALVLLVAVLLVWTWPAPATEPRPRPTLIWIDGVSVYFSGADAKVR